MRLVALALTAAMAVGFGATSQLLARQAGLGGRISCELAAVDGLNSSQKQAIKDFADSALARLKDADPAVSTKARDELIEPLSCPAVSVGFRIELGQAVGAELRRLASGSDLRLAANALLIMGKVKSTASITLLRQGLDDRRPAVRLAAAAGHKDLLSPPASGLPDRTIEQVVDTLAEALAKETDATVADSLVAALDAAQSSEAIRTRANSAMVDAITTRIRELKGADPAGAWATPILRAVDVTRGTLFQRLGANDVDREFAKRAGVMSAFALAYVRDRLTPDAGANSTFIQTARVLVIAAERQVVFAHTPAAGTATKAIDLESAFDRFVSTGATTEFNQRLAAWIGPGGLFLKAPYSIAAADLAPKS